MWILSLLMIICPKSIYTLEISESGRRNLHTLIWDNREKNSKSKLKLHIKIKEMCEKKILWKEIKLGKKFSHHIGWFVAMMVATKISDGSAVEIENGRQSTMVDRIGVTIEEYWL